MLPIDEEIISFHGRHLLFVSGPLSAIVYDRSMPEGSYASRRGIVWDWTTGDIVYVGHPLSFEHFLFS